MVRFDWFNNTRFDLDGESGGVGSEGIRSDRHA